MCADEKVLSPHGGDEEKVLCIPVYYSYIQYLCTSRTELDFNFQAWSIYVGMNELRRRRK
jgi:hypothetical protein